MSNKKLTIGLVVAIVIAITGLFFPLKQTILSFGGVTNYDELDATAVKVGSNGSRYDLIATGTCNLSQSVNGSHAATTSKEYFCAATGAAAGDVVQIALPAGAGNNPNGAGSLAGGFTVNGSYSTTTDVIAVQLLNVTGVATSSFVQATTSVVYTIWSTRSTVPGL